MHNLSNRPGEYHAMTTSLPAPCKHNARHFCGFCEYEHLPRCSHGNHSFCGFCRGNVDTAGQHVAMKPCPDPLESGRDDQQD